MDPDRRSRVLSLADQEGGLLAPVVRELLIEVEARAQTLNVDALNAARDELQSQLHAVTAERDRLQTLLASIQPNMDAAAQQAAQAHSDVLLARSEAEQLRAALQPHRDTNIALTTENDNLNDTLDNYSSRINHLTREVEDLNARLAEYESPR